MNERDWRSFLKQGAGRAIKIAQVPRRIQDRLGSVDDKVRLHHTYAVKAADKHKLNPVNFSIIFDAIERGVAISDRPRHVTFFHFDLDEEKWFQVSVKCSGDTNMLYLATFHRVTAARVKNRFRKFEKI